MIRAHLPYVISDIDRHGNVRYYVRRKGHRKVRLPGRPGDAAFMEAYQAALERTDKPADPQTDHIAHGSLRWLAMQYFASSEFAQLAEITRKRRRAVLDEIWREPVSPDDPDGLKIGDTPAHKLEPKHVRILRDRRADRIEAANWRLRALRALLKWAKDSAYLLDINAARDVPMIRNDSEGFHTVTMDEVRQYEAHHPLGTTPRLALALFLYTGGRRGDVAILGRQHLEGTLHDGWLCWTQQKGRSRKARRVEIPVLPELAEAIEAGPAGDLTFLVNKWGKPYTVESLGNAMRKWFDTAGLKSCSAHGLRKAGACIAAENGATEAQLMAIFGWDTANMAQFYTRQARRRKMAGEAIHLLARREE